MDGERMNIGDVLKNWRVMERMTLREAAPRLGLTVPTLQRIESGHAVEGSTVVKIMVFLFGPAD
jgi:cytoskeletal protein RodZ